MENRNILKQRVSIVGIILLSALIRVLPHPANFAPIGALALLTGAKLDIKSALIIPLATMFISDLFLGAHPTMIFVYGSFVLIVFIGTLLKKNNNIVKMFTASFISSILFFLITNFGSWLTMNMYSKTLSGLIDAYIMGIPFFRNTFFSDLFYSFSFFYGYKYLTNYFRVILNGVKDLTLR